MRENSAAERLYNGIVKENPTFVLMLGMCPTLAVTTSAVNGLGMGLTTAVVLALSNMLISLMRRIIPDSVRIPAFIVIIASFVTVVQLLLEAYLPSLNEALGVYIPLIVVNCIILGRAEAYAYFHGPVASLFDGIGMGLGFSVSLTCIGAVRELLGAGEIFGYPLLQKYSWFTPIGIFVLAPGAFFVLAALSALRNFVKKKGEEKGRDMSHFRDGCGHDCLNCAEKAECSQKEQAEPEEKDAVRSADSGEPEETEQKKTTEKHKNAAKRKEAAKHKNEAEHIEAGRLAEADETVEIVDLDGEE